VERACLDTSVLIELSRRRLIGYVDLEDGLAIPAIVLYEYLRGLAYLGRDLRKARRALERRFTIIGLSSQVAEVAAGIYAELRSRGILVPDPDILIAATCISSDLPLATHNTKHFKKIPKLRIIDPEAIIEELEKAKGLTEGLSSS